MATVFQGQIPYYVKDRDGYEQLAHTTGIVLTFKTDGQLEVAEAGAAEPTLTGRWYDRGKTVRLSLERVAHPPPSSLEVPGDGSEYYAYPSQASNAVLPDGMYTALIQGEEMYLVDAPSELVNHDEPRPVHLRAQPDGDVELPSISEKEELHMPKPWHTYQSEADVVDVQFNSDDDPYELTRVLILRIARSVSGPDARSVSAWEHDEHLPHDYGWISPPDLSGTYEYGVGDDGGARFELERHYRENQTTWADHWSSGVYRALSWKGAMWLQRVPELGQPLPEAMSLRPYSGGSEIFYAEEDPREIWARLHAEGALDPLAGVAEEGGGDAGGDDDAGASRADPDAADSREAGSGDSEDGDSHDEWVTPRSQALASGRGCLPTLFTVWVVALAASTAVALVMGALR